MLHKVVDIKVHLVSLPVKSGLADSTRKVETAGFTVVRVLTDSGFEGIGITYHEVGGEAIKSLVIRSLAPRLIGRTPFETEVIWQDLVRFFRGVGRKGLAFLGLSAVDIALWDLKGKIINMPLYRLLGGNNPRVPVYASGGWTSHGDDELVENIKLMADQGYHAIKMKVGVDAGLNPQRDAKRVRMVREAIGPDIRLMLDANNCWDAATSVQFANSVRECGIFFMEEPVMADDIPGLARFRRVCDIPLATGEHEYTSYGVRDLLLSEAVDVVQTDVTKTGGITETLKIGALTQAWNLKFAPHAMEHMHMHLVAAMPNGLFVERLDFFEELTSCVFKNAPLPKDGYIEIPDHAGLGLDLNMEFLEEHDQIV